MYSLSKLRDVSGTYGNSVGGQVELESQNPRGLEWIASVIFCPKLSYTKGNVSESVSKG